MSKLTEGFGRPSLAEDSLDKYKESADWPSPTGVEATGGGGHGGSSAGQAPGFFGSIGGWVSSANSDTLSITVESDAGTCTAASSERDEVSVATTRTQEEEVEPEESALVEDEAEDEGVEAEFASMDIGETIGVGSFSRVKIAVVRPNGAEDDEGARACAIKVCHKTRILEADEVLSILREKEALSIVSHPFIMELYGTHQDDDRCYFVCEYIPGGELFTYIHNVCGGSMAEMDAQFYAACLADVFEHAHANGVLNRDAKPENIVIDAYGYPKLCDWGFAKTNVRATDKCHTICGTLEYLSREALLNLGYSFDVDLWTLGVLLFEMIAGRTPFFDPLMADNLQQQSIYNNILHGDIVPAQWEMPRIVHRLLELHADHRLGADGGAAAVKRDPFFADVDFDALRNRELLAPWTPMLQSETDITHFQDQGVDMGEDEDVDLVFTGDQNLFATF